MEYLYQIPALRVQGINPAEEGAERVYNLERMEDGKKTSPFKSTRSKLIGTYRDRGRMHMACTGLHQIRSWS